MLLRTLMSCVLSCGLVACGGDDGGGDGGGGLSGLFESLNGEYEVDDDLDCVISILGSRFGTRNAAGATTCTQIESDGDHKTLMVQGTLSDTRLTGRLVYEIMGVDELFEDCTLRFTGHTVVEASATKSMGRTSEGRFAGLAGVWEGQLTVVETQSETPTEDSGPGCEGFNDGSETNTYNFMADIYGSFGTVTYEDGDDIESFEIAESGDGAIVVDGEPISVH